MNISDITNLLPVPEAAPDYYYTTSTIQTNLLIILTACNLFSLAVCVKIIYNFFSAMARGKEDRQKRKRNLYLNSAIFIMCIGLIVLALLLTPYMPGYFFGDLWMEFSLTFSFIFWWAQWKQSVYLHIQNKYV
jgi:Na+/H+ antiporter NhaD/arsenite permease-like protein